MADHLGSIETWTTSDGYQGYYRLYQPSSAPKGILICLHGIQSHGGWYEQSSTRLAQAGYVVAYLDRRGSGLNFSQRGDTPSFQRLLQDVAEFVEVKKKRWPQLPIAVSACSWGGKVAVGLCREQPQLFQTMLLLCPGFFPQVGVSLRTKLKIGRSKIFRPARLFDIPLNDPALFTASWTGRQFLRHDPLALRQATARFLIESVRLDRYIREVPSSVTMPVLLMLAGQDRIIKNDSTCEFVASFASKEKRIIEYPYAHHTFEFEPNLEEFVADQVNWLQQVLHLEGTSGG